MLHAVAAGLAVAAEDLVRAVRYGLVHAQRHTGVGLTPRGVRVLAIVHGEIAAAVGLTELDRAARSGL